MYIQPCINAPFSQTLILVEQMPGVMLFLERPVLTGLKTWVKGCPSLQRDTEKLTLKVKNKIPD